MGADNDNTLKVAYRAAYALALVAVVFSLVVGTLMGMQFVASRAASPLNTPEYDRLCRELKANPQNESLKNRIRDLDLMTRRLYFTSLIAEKTGGYLLLIGVVVALVSMKTISAIRRRQPNPKEYPPAGDSAQTAATARWTIGGLAVVLIAGAVVIGAMPRERPAGVMPVTGVTGTGGVTQVVSAGDPATNWPSFRGVSGCGTCTYTNLPVSWDVKTSNNVRWKVEVPLPGVGSPVIWGNRVMVAGASEEKREVFCYDIASGTLMWQSELSRIADGPVEKPSVNQDTGYAASTPVTDGVYIYAMFANGDIGSIDFCAQKKWAMNLGLPANTYGHSASLAICGNRVLVQFDQNDSGGAKSALIAIDALTGKEAWRTDRPVADSWPSPIVVKTGTGMQVVTSASGWIIGYDAETGKELWKVACGGSDVSPSPIFAGGLVIVSVTGDKVYAIRPDGRGDISATHVAWTSDEGVSDVASPVSNGELVLLVASSGMLTCFEVASGKKVWNKELDGSFYASPGIAGDRCYLVARDGKVVVFKVGRQYEEVGRAELGENSDSSPAFVGGRIVFRGMKNLICIGNK